MRNIGVITLVLLVLVLMIPISCGPKITSPPVSERAPVPAGPARESWQATWEKVVSMAKKEGKVVIFGAVSGETTTALGKAFRERHGMGAEFIGGAGGEIAQKIIAERKAGLFLADVFLGGANSGVTMLKPAGLFDPLEPAFILPEVTDPKLWVFGFDFVDRDRTMLPYLAYAVPPMVINTNLVKPDEIKVYRDLLQPKWKGKIVMQDPSGPGTAGVWFGVVSEFIMGLDYLRELAKQEPVITRDRRLQVEWLALGKYLIAIAPQSDITGNFIKGGAPIKKHSVAEGTFRTAGSGFIALVNQAPRPNAARLFINWMLGKEGQIVYSQQTLLPSARIDVPKDWVDPDSVIQPGVKYYEVDREDHIRQDVKRWAAAREIFGPLVR